MFTQASTPQINSTMSQNFRRIKEKLESQKGGQQLLLNDIILSEEGCKQVAEFLQQNNQFTSIEIKGNNITPKGFACICSSLRNFTQLREINAEWNQIGQSLEGLEALGNLLQKLQNLSIIDLKNNQIRPDGAAILANIIKRNESLLALDLKWNELGIKGGELILEALATNSKIKSLDLSCNKVSEEIVSEINRLLARNRKGVAPAASNQFLDGPSGGGAANQQPSQQQRNQFQRMGASQPVMQEEPILIQNQQFEQMGRGFQPQVQTAPIEGFQQAPTMADIETSVVYERQRVQELKEKCERQIQEEKQIRYELETNLQRLREEVIKKETTSNNLDFQYKGLQSDNSALRMELDQLKNDIVNLQESYGGTMQDLQNQLVGKNRTVANLERTLNQEIDQTIGENQNYLNNLVKDWTQQYNKMEERYKQTKAQRDEIQEQVDAINENILRRRIDHEEQLRLTKFKLQDSEAKRYVDSIQQLQNQLKLLKEQQEQICRQNTDLYKEMQYSQIQNSHKIIDLQNEIQSLHESINDSHKSLSQLNVEIEDKNRDLIIKDAIIVKIQREIEQAQGDLNMTKELSKEQVDHQILQHNMERRLWKENLETQHKQIIELERAISTQEAQSANIKSDYERLCNSLQHNINKTISDLMIQQKSYVSQVDVVMQPYQTQQQPVIIVREQSPQQQPPILVRDQQPVIIREQQPVIIREPQPVVIREQQPVIIREQQPVIVREQQPVLVREQQPVIIRESSPYVVREQQQQQQPFIIREHQQLPLQGHVHVVQQPVHPPAYVEHPVNVEQIRLRHNPIQAPIQSVLQ